MFYFRDKKIKGIRELILVVPSVSPVILIWYAGLFPIPQVANPYLLLHGGPEILNLTMKDRIIPRYFNLFVILLLQFLLHLYPQFKVVNLLSGRHI